MIRSLLLSGAASLALATGSMAADLPNIKGPPVYAPPPPPVFSWTGFYVGGNAGLSVGQFTQNHYSDYGRYFLHGETARASGFSGGGQIGFNYQFENNVVVGLEADFQGSTLEGNYPNTFNAYAYNYYYSPSDRGNGAGESELQQQSHLDWWGTARGRLGYAFGNVLPYVTGGFAYGQIGTNSTYSAEGYGYYDGTEIYSYNYTKYKSYSGTVPGWTVGAGVEYAITHNLTAKVEYLYTDLADLNHSCGDGCDGYYTKSTQLSFHTVRAGLNWKFDWFAPPAPVVTKY